MQLSGRLSPAKHASQDPFVQVYPPCGSGTASPAPVAQAPSWPYDSPVFSHCKSDDPHSQRPLRGSHANRRDGNHADVLANRGGGKTRFQIQLSYALSSPEMAPNLASTLPRRYHAPCQKRLDIVPDKVSNQGVNKSSVRGFRSEDIQRQSIFVMLILARG